MTRSHDAAIRFATTGRKADALQLLREIIADRKAGVELSPYCYAIIWGREAAARLAAPGVAGRINGGDR